MENIRRLVKAALEPDDINVLWVDVSNPQNFIFRLYRNGRWDTAATQAINDPRILGVDTVPTLNSPNVITSGGVYTAIHSIESAQIQADWNQTDTTAKDYIKNKPTTFGEITEIIMNNNSVPISNGIANLGTVLTEHQSLTNYYTKSEINGLLDNCVYSEDYDSSSEIDDLVPSSGGDGGGDTIVVGLSDEIKQALLDLFNRVAYVSSDGLDYYAALEAAFYPITSITATFTQGANIIYDTASLDDLKEYLVVTGTYGTNQTKIITDYTLSGTLLTGTSTITVTYKDTIITTFNVTVTHEAGRFGISNNLTNCTTSNNDTSVVENSAYSAIISPSLGYSLTGATVTITMDGVDITSTAYSNGNISIASVTGAVVITVSAIQIVVTSISATYTQAGTVYTTDSLDSLKTNLVVKANYSDNSETTLQSTDYTLSGTLTTGTSVVTVTYGSFTTTFNVTVTQAVTLSYINANYTQSGTVYAGTSVETLRSDLSVEAYYNDNSHRTVTDYTLSGDLIAGNRDITVTYSGQTTTFVVTVTAVEITGITAVYTQSGAVYSDDSLDSLKNNLVVTASYNNNTTETIASANYTLSGTLTVGTSTITVSYSGQIATFNVTVSQAEDWDYNWVAATSNHTAPTGMTQYGTPVWGTNDEYYEVQDPKLPGDTSLIGSIILEVDMKWKEQGSYSAGSTIVASSAQKTGCKIFLANSSGNINMYSAASSGGSSALKTIGTDWSNFHKYRFELVGDLCKTYIDGVLVDTGYTYYSSWNGHPIIWSENQSNGRCTMQFKSIKYKRIATVTSITATYNQSEVVYATDDLNTLKPDLVVTAHYNDNTTATIPSTDYILSGTLVAETSTITVAYEGKTTTFNVNVYDAKFITGLTWTLGYIDNTGALATDQTDAGVYTCSSFYAYDYTKLAFTLDGATSVVTSYYNDSYELISQESSATSDIPSNARFIRITITKASLGNDGYNGTGSTIFLSTDKFVSSIAAVFTQGSLDVYPETDLNVLKTRLVVTATYSDTTTNTILDYSLSGTLTEGTSTITVSYRGKTSTFNVTVNAMPTVASGYTRYGYIRKKAQSTSKVAVGNFIYLPAATDYNLLSLECVLGAVATPGTNGGSEGYFGARAASGSGVPYFGVYWQSDGKINVAARDYWSTFNVTAGTLKTRLVVDNKTTSPFYVYSNEAVTNGRPYIWTSSPVLNYTMSLFNNIPSGSTSTFNINYNAKIGDMIFRDITGHCVAYYVPVVDSNNKIGMFDLIGQQFYTASTAAAVTTTNSGCYYSVANW